MSRGRLKLPYRNLLLILLSATVVSCTASGEYGCVEVDWFGVTLVCIIVGMVGLLLGTWLADNYL